MPCILADVGMFSFLPISRHTMTELHEPACLHKIASFLCASGITLPMSMKDESGISLHRSICESFRESGYDCLEREKLLGSSAGQFVKEWMAPLAIGLFAVSQAVLPKFDDLPSQYSQRVHWPGSWLVPELIQQELAKKGDPNFSSKDGGQQDTRERIIDFLDRMKKKGHTHAPAYLGWGSMVAVSKEHMTKLAVQSLKDANLCGIILGGFADLNFDLLQDSSLKAYAEENVMFLSSAPHDYLFPLCSVIVHHGGAGTTAAALRSGIPTIITPCIADQFDNAALVESAGCGIGFRKPLKKIAYQMLANAMLKCSADDSEGNNAFKTKSRQISDTLRQENGVQNAVQHIDEFVETRLDTGDWLRDYNDLMKERADHPASFVRMFCRTVFLKRPFG